MFIEDVLISGPIGEAANKKIGGLYLIERNIKLLSQAGIKRIYIDFSGSDLELFNKKVLKYIKKVKAEIITDNSIIPNRDLLKLTSEIFLQPQYFNYPEKYFKEEDMHYTPIISDELFEIQNKKDIRKGEKLISKYIIENTGGFVAQKINKRISLPISIRLAKTRIHPNYLTFFNMIIGFLSSYFIYLSTYSYSSDRVNYLLMVLGGLFFQAASVLDGVDGEVAKFTLTVSKFGGWLDTFSDNMTLLLFLISNSYLYYIVMGGIASFVTIVVLFISLAVMLYIMINYLSKFSNSGSLVAYDREFLQTLPESNLVKFALKMKYLTKKELFSIIFCLMGFTGYIYLIIPMAAFVLLAAAFILTIINFRFMKELEKNKG